MASRDYTKHLVSTSEPTASTLGDEWYNPTTNRLYKRMATNGTTVEWKECVIANTPSDVANSAASYANAAFLAANAATATDTTQNNSITAAFTVANNALTSANGTIIWNTANAAFTVANNALTSANGTIIWNTANAAFIAANAATATDTTQNNSITAAFARANNSINANTGGTITGNTLISVGNVGIGTITPDANLTVNGAASFAAGTALLPSIARAGDLNTGIYFPAADTIAFTEGGVEAMRIDASGNVGIGTTSPTLPLNIGTSTLPAGVTIGGQMISSDVAATTPLLSIRRSAASGNPIFAQFASSGTAASPTAVAINRGLGRNDWWGFDGTNYINAAAITSAADGVVSSGVVPGRIVFSTSTTNTPVERMRIDSSGNVGIGTSSANSALHVAAPIGTPSGNGVFLGTDGNYGAMQFNGSAGGFIDFSTSGTDFKGRIIYDNAINAMYFYTNTAERMRLGLDGAMYLNTTVNPLTNSLGQVNMVAGVGDGFNIKHTINGNNLLNLWQTGTTTFAAMVFYKGDSQNDIGNISVSTTAVAYNTSSDYRLKENVTTMTGALTKIAQLKPVTYTWKENGIAGQGFIAHELQEVVPDAVTGEKDEVYSNGNPKYQGVDTSFLVATLVAAIQEQQALITQLQADVAELKGST